MSIFIKTETIKKNLLLNNNFRKETISNHIKWVKQLKSKGINIKSGYLIDSFKQPGGGGLLFIECNTYSEAEMILKNDPMIQNNLVDWNLHEWIDVIEKNN